MRTSSSGARHPPLSFYIERSECTSPGYVPRRGRSSTPSRHLPMRNQSPPHRSVSVRRGAKRSERFHGTPWSARTEPPKHATRPRAVASRARGNPVRLPSGGARPTWTWCFTKGWPSGQGLSCRRLETAPARSRPGVLACLTGARVCALHELQGDTYGNRKRSRILSGFSGAAEAFHGRAGRTAQTSTPGWQLTGMPSEKRWLT